MAVVVITGASSGFGLQAALAFARNGDRVVATMRDSGKATALTEQAGTENLSIETVRLDVTESATFAAVFAEIVDRFGSIDVLVNNAGILHPGALEDLSEAKIRQVMETNFIGPLLLSRAVLPQMRAQQQGHIIMVSSLSGIAGLPCDVTYTGSKFALEGASEALRHEVDRWGIKVSLIQAGMYATQIFPDAEGDLLPADYPVESPYRSLIETKLHGIYESLQGAFDPAAVGQLMVDIAASDRDQLRWPADAVAETVLGKMLAQSDDERDAFLKQVSGTEWWSRGEAPPEKRE